MWLRLILLPITALVQGDLSTYVGRPVQLNLWWPEFWRPTPLETALPNLPVCLRRPFLPNWFISDDLNGQVSPKPFITHALIMLPTFNHILQVIRRRTPPTRAREKWVPRQIFGSTSPSNKWRPNAEGTGSRPDVADIVTLENDEDVRAWMAASANHSILRLCVVFHQADHLGNQTPAPEFRPYLKPEIYQITEQEEKDRFGNGDRTRTRVPAPVPAPTPVPARPTLGESVSMGTFRERAQWASVQPNLVPRLGGCDSRGKF